TRMWRIDESISGSYTGRIAPPGRPNMTSTPSISRLLIRAWAPVSYMVPSSAGFVMTEAGMKNPSPGARGGSAHGRVAATVRYITTRRRVGDDIAITLPRPRVHG